MKKILIALSCLFIICGCSTTNNETDKKEETTQEETTKKGAVAEETTQDIIDTEYFTVVVPDSWEGLYEYDIYQDENGYSLVFYEKDSHASMDAGHLMSISLYLEDEDYSYLPCYEELGKLDTGEYIYNVLVEYPTDVQFDESDAAKYQQLSNTMESILETIEANEGCTYSEKL